MKRIALQCSSVQQKIKSCFELMSTHAIVVMYLQPDDLYAIRLCNQNLWNLFMPSFISKKSWTEQTLAKLSMYELTYVRDVVFTSLLDIPPQITSLKLLYFRSELRVGDLPSKLTSLELGVSFNVKLDVEVFPETLTSLKFGECFDQAICRGIFPSCLLYLKFGNFNQPLEPYIFPSTLTVLEFGQQFNQVIACDVLPKRLTKLSFGYFFNQSLSGCVLPTSLKELSLSAQFSHKLKDFTHLDTLIFDNWRIFPYLRDGGLPAGLTKLSVGDYLGQPLEAGMLPSSLLDLEFGRAFDFSLEGVLPNLQKLKFGTCFDQSLARCLPSTLTALALGDAFNQPLEKETLPSALVDLSFGFKFNQSIANVLPTGLVKLTVWTDCQQSVFLPLPTSLSTLTYGYASLSGPFSPTAVREFWLQCHNPKTMFKSTQF